MAEPILVGKNEAQESVRLYPEMANRHGLIAGATGTGKTLSLKRLAEQFSAMGVPVFITDIKGDLSGLSEKGDPHNPKIAARLSELQLNDFTFEPFPLTQWDVFGVEGIPLRTTVSEMGPLLLAELLDLNPTQSGVLTTAFKIADDQGLLLLDLKDLQALLNHVAQENKTYSPTYGNIASVTVNAIQRQLTGLSSALQDNFFGEPSLVLTDLLQTDSSTGKGMIHLLMARQLLLQPRLYALFLLWFLSELFETLPEVGDLEKPKLVVFFDEAHVLFNNMPSVLRDKIKQVTLLIRSKGVGLYFVTQNPQDIDEDVLGQLGNRIQHALRIFTPNDKKALKALAGGFRENPDLDLEALIPMLGVGEAIVSTLDEKGMPAIPVKTRMVPPQSANGPAQNPDAQDQSGLRQKYRQAVDRQSAYEHLQQRVVAAAPPSQSKPSQNTPVRRASKDPGQLLVESAARAIGGQVGRSLIRGILGSLMRRH
ncbi:MAG: DUF853 family protein [Vampirovibrionales bacterium]|nr:DUF853 family protein [Vampirovibrionales bacterium]